MESNQILNLLRRRVVQQLLGQKNVVQRFAAVHEHYEI